MYRWFLGTSAVALAGLVALAGYAPAQEKKEGPASGQNREGAAANTQRNGSGAAVQQQQGWTTDRYEGDSRSWGEIRYDRYFSGPYYYEGGPRYGWGYSYRPGSYSFGWRPRYFTYGSYDSGYYFGDSYYGDPWYGPRPRPFFRPSWIDYNYGFVGPYYYYASPYASYPFTDSGIYHRSTGSGYAYGAMDPNSALIDVKLGAADAQVSFDDTPTQQTGDMRQFITPSLEPGKNFSYMIHARWKQGDRDMDDTRKVTVHAGERVKVDFTSRQEEGQGNGAKPEAAPRPGKGDSGALPTPRAPQVIPPRPEGDQGRIEVHEGKFLSFREGTLEMTDPEGKKHSHYLAPGAQVIIDGKPAKPEDLKADMKIKVSTKKGDSLTATKIEVNSQGYQNGDKPAPDLGAPPPQPKQNGEKQAPDKSQIPPPQQPKL
jgi:uncharacterized protein (TIGR03000 family)